jgi:predicted nuclease of predicted toxin-antitoxin system
MRVIIDENLSPDLVSIARSRGYYATCNRDMGWLGLKDHVLLPLCIAANLTFCTIDAGDPARLAERAEVHAGLILLAKADYGGSAVLLEEAFSYIEARAASSGETPESFMINRVVEHDEAGEWSDRELPPT